MNDKSIREILISWLQATNHEIRIYQEKSIGAYLQIPFCAQVLQVLQFAGAFPDVLSDCHFLCGESSRECSEAGRLYGRGNQEVSCADTVLKSFQKFSDKDKEHLDSMIARKIDLQKMVRTPDPSYAEKLACCEKEAEELRQLITSREQSNPNAALL